MAEFFTERGLTLDCALNGRAGLDCIAANPYDLVILDVMMPGMDGFEVLRQLREKYKVPVLMLTARTEQASRIRGLETGADDYLPKPFDPLELLARVRAILRRVNPSVAPSKVLEASGVRLDPGARSVTQNGQPVTVTSIEYDILEVLIRAAGTVVSRDDLMNRLYQREATPFDRSIDVHVSHLRKKLTDSDALIRTVRGIGYQFCAPEATP
ncbi:MAG: response regulator transcription factor [Bryobacteraceae bacterium]|nr:response regulator transcription factor [Bryobacteraceae bacterium]